MGLSCILTDSAAQYPKPRIPQSIAGILPNRVNLGDSVTDISQLHLTHLPEWVSRLHPPLLLPPDEESLTSFLLDYQQRFDDLFLILTSASLYPAVTVIEKIASKKFGRAKLHIIDSQSTSIGEGILIQKTIEMINNQVPADLIEENLRGVLPHIFTLLCTPNFSYLHKYGFLDRGQAITGELLSVYPVLSLDNGNLNPLEKFKSIRSLMEYFIEFIDEFDRLESISLIFPEGIPAGDIRSIKQYVEDQHPEARFFEYPLNPFLASIIGPRGMGLVIEENPN